MDFKMENSFCWPKDDIVDVLASGEEPVSMDMLPGVTSYKINDFRKTDDGFLKKIEWIVQAEIPFFARKVINPDKLQFDEETSWSNDTATFTTKVTPHFLKGKIKCMIVARWDHDGEAGSKRHVDISLKVRLPLIGSKLEIMLGEILKQNNEDYADLLTESFSEMFGQTMIPDKPE